MGHKIYDWSEQLILKLLKQVLKSSFLLAVNFFVWDVQEKIQNNYYKTLL